MADFNLLTRSNMQVTVTVKPDHIVVSEHAQVAVWQNTATKHHSLHALRAFQPGDIITGFSAGAILPAPTYLTLQLDTHRHITLLPAYLQYTNHSCDPNIFFDTTAMQLLCIRPVQPGDEMRFFYPATEWNMAQPFVCNCGSDCCLQLINGAAGMNDNTVANYRLTDFILQQLKHRRENR